MSLRRQRPTDSLDMLLDTMCNTFGGIILLAVLVTLLTSTERQGTIGSSSDTQEMLQRRLVLAQTNLNQALELRKLLQAKATDERWKTQMSLLSTRQQMQAEIRAVRELAVQGEKDLDAAASLDPAERVKELRAELATAQTRKTEAQNSLAASRENAKRLSTRLAALEKQASDLVSESQRELRLPKEHETSKRVIYVIARYGRIYTCRNADLSRNESDIDWDSSSLTEEIAEPKAGRGIDPVSGASGFRAYLRNISGNSVYFAFCVFEDSFPAFIRARQLVTESGLAYGWDPFRLSEGPVTFSAIGHRPKPQ